MSVVTLDYNDLINGVDLTDQIAEAYGYDGLGVLTVKNVPKLSEYRYAMLPLAKKFAELPDDVKEKYVHEESCYSFGWSHGKEKLQGKPDDTKGSYYGNPQYDRPVEDEELVKKYSPFVHPNIWPTEDLPEFEQAFKNLGCLIIHVGELIAQQCDNYVRARCPSYPENRLTRIIKNSRCAKARLLHYFARDTPEEDPSSKVGADDEFSSWCGWHNDHGSLTGLTSALFLDKDNNEVDMSDDPTAGLYCRSRASQLVKVNIPIDHLGYQIGEVAQVHSGGILQATPHAVRGSKLVGISRETYAVFMEPMWDEPMDFPEGIDLEAVQSQSSAANLPKGVPPLKSRWAPGQDFGDFTTKTLAAFY